MREIKKELTNINHNEGTIDRIKYIVIHYVGATGSAKANCNYYKTANRNASAHYFVDFNGDIYQSVEDKDIAWHCGAKTYLHPDCRNANSIGIEMCVRCKGKQTADSKDWYFEKATVDSAIELTKYLMEKYHISEDRVIRHYDVTGKICPNPYVYNHTEYTWDKFKQAIGTVLNGWKLNNNIWKYYENGKAVANCWKLINHHWYYFDEMGNMLTGWQLINNEWYYLEENGDYEGACWHETEKHNGSLERWYVE